MNRLSTILLLFAVAGSALAGECKSTLAVSARHVKATTIEFVVRNDSAAGIEMFQADLPWGNRRSIVALAARATSGTPLELAVPIDDPSPLTTVLPADSELVGKIDLRYYFKSIEDELKDGEVVFFWHYRAHTAQRACVANAGGFVLLSDKAENGTE